MIKAVAVDDEVNALGIIKEFCNRIPNINLVNTFEDPLEAKKILQGNSEINLIFLDIQMANMNGLALAAILPKNIKIVLTTAYAEYALESYELDVVDYLLKPFSFERFKRSIGKVKLALTDPETQQLENLPLIAPTFHDTIFVKTDFKMVRVRLADIIYIEGSGNYVTLHTIKGKLMALQNMKHFEVQLQPYQFIRIHKSYIVSLHYIDSVEKNELTINGKSLVLGESYKAALQRFISTNFKQF